MISPDGTADLIGFTSAYALMAMMLLFGFSAYWTGRFFYRFGAFAVLGGFLFVFACLFLMFSIG